MRNKKGFTLIEMLVVIAIISFLISIIVPNISNNIKRAKATTDAANLRTVLGQVNAFFVSDTKFDSVTASQLKTADSKSFPGAKTYILYCDTYFVETYYVIENRYYGIEYFTDIIETGASSRQLSKPEPPAGSGLIYEWFEAGVGAVTEEDGE